MSGSELVQPNAKRVLKEKKRLEREQQEKQDSAFEVSRRLDLANAEVPECLYWSVAEVCEFFERKLKLKDYRETLESNGINGRRLIYLDASHLPKIGIVDFKDIMLITKSVRELLKSKDPYWNRSITLPPRENLELYLEAKSVNGKNSDNLNYGKFKGDTEDVAWKPPLTNQGFILPSF